MSVMNKLTPEQIDAFEECETKEELIAKAQELGVEYTEEELAEAVALMKGESGELSDDALDAVAGGDSGYKKGYKKVDRRDKCTINQWQKAAVPVYPGVKKPGKCGNCEFGRKIKNELVCIKQYKA